jgi:DNA polymerase-3 subunit chi
MPTVTFYSLTTESTDNGLSPEEQMACDFAASLWQTNQRLLLACVDEAQAYRLDEALWCLPPQRFVPHALAGENWHLVAPVVIHWPQQPHSGGRVLLITLLSEIPEFVSHFSQVIDFVPLDPQRKQQARRRYQAYRKANFELIMAEPSPAVNNDEHGKNL